GAVESYGFNDSTRSTRDAPPRNGNSGTLTIATWSAAGKFGGPLSFNVTNAWVTVSDAPGLRLTNGMTLEAWVKPTSVSGWRSVLLKERPGALSYSLYATDPGRSPSAPASFINTGGADVESWGTAALAVNTW